MRYVKNITLFLLFFAIMWDVHLQAQSWWSQTSNTSHNVMDIEFINNMDGYAVADSASTILKTNDQGATWNQLNPGYTRGELQAITFLNASTLTTVGWDVISGNGLVMKTTNSGNDWTARDTFPDKLYDVDFSGTSKGWICGENGYIARTTDGGSSWSRLSTGTGQDFFALQFLNDNDGWAVGTVDTSAIVLHTKDGGTTWQRQQNPSMSPFFDVFFLDSTYGWTAAANGYIARTTNGGATWDTIPTGTGNDLFDIQFLSPSYGWVVGGSGTVLVSTDSGKTWTANPPNTGQDILALELPDDSLAWIGGDAGTIEIYSPDEPTPNTGIGYRQSHQLQVYPNPVQETMHIHLANPATMTMAKQPIKLTLYNSLGQSIVTKQWKANHNKIMIQRNQLPAGLYILKVSDHQTSFTQKVFLK